jgi:Ca-activated chloride channel family protein
MIISWGNLAGCWLLVPILASVFLLLFLVLARIKLANYLMGVGLNNFDKYKGRLKIKLVLWIATLVLLFIAFLAPKWGEQNKLIAQNGRNVIIALDVSKSMLGQDLHPNRLDFAKNKIKKLVAQMAGSQIGLVLFAGDAFVLCPLTRDRDLLLTFLDDVSVQNISSGTTNLASAMTSAVRMVKQAGGAGTNLLVFFTDGEDFAQNLGPAQQAAKEIDLHIFTFGVASLQGAPIPDLDQDGKQLGFIKDQQNKIVISKLNQDLLLDLADKCGGQFVLATTSNDTDLASLRTWVEQFERHQFMDQQLVTKPEKYYYFAGLAFILFLLEWLL